MYYDMREKGVLGLRSKHKCQLFKAVVYEARMDLQIEK